MTSNKKYNKSAKMGGFPNTYQVCLFLSRDMERKRKFPHVKYVKAEILYQQRRH